MFSYKQILYIFEEILFMRAVDAIKTRRSVKHFDPKHKLSDAEVEDLLSLAILSPTAFNIQNWRYVIVSDPALRQQIQDSADGQVQITESSLLVVLCADLMAWDKAPQQYWQDSPEDIQNIMVPMISQFFSGNAQLQRDEAMRSCGIAAQTLMIAAKSMGYDSCPMDGFDFERVAELIRLPDDHIISMFVVIGKALQPARSRPGQLPLNSVRVDNTFS